MFICCKKKVAVGQHRSSILNTERNRAYPKQVANDRVLVPECDLGVSVVLDETTGRGQHQRRHSRKRSSLREGCRGAIRRDRSGKEMCDLRIQGSRGPGSEEHVPLSIPNQSQMQVSAPLQLQRPPVWAEPSTGDRDLGTVSAALTLTPLSLNIPSCTSNQSICRLPGSLGCVYSHPPTARRYKASRKGVFCQLRDKMMVMDETGTGKPLPSRGRGHPTNNRSGTNGTRGRTPRSDKDGRPRAHLCWNHKSKWYSD